MMADEMMHINTLSLAAGVAPEIAVLVRVILRPHREPASRWGLFCRAPVSSTGLTPEPAVPSG